MGCNYYVTKNGPSAFGGYHLGKSSAGWLFNFQVQRNTWSDPPVVWSTYEEVKAWLKHYTVDTTDYCIVDEYDRVVPYREFIELVESKQSDEFCRNNPDNFSYSKNVFGYRFTDEDFS